MSPFPPVDRPEAISRLIHWCDQHQSGFVVGELQARITLLHELSTQLSDRLSDDGTLVAPVVLRSEAITSHATFWDAFITGLRIHLPTPREEAEARAMQALLAPSADRTAPTVAWVLGYAQRQHRRVVVIIDDIAPLRVLPAAVQHVLRSWQQDGLLMLIVGRPQDPKEMDIDPMVFNGFSQHLRLGADAEVGGGVPHAERRRSHRWLVVAFVLATSIIIVAMIVLLS